MIINKKYLSFMFIFFLVVPLFAAHEVKLKEWEYAISPFTSATLDQGSRYLLKSLPLLLQHELAACDIHIFTEKEMDYHRKLYAKKLIDSKIKALASKHAARDNLLFNQPFNQEQYDKLSSEIQKLKKEIEGLRKLDKDKVKMSDYLPVKIKSGTADDPLFSYEEAELEESTADFLEKNSLQCLVSGNIENFEEYYLISVDYYQAHQQDPVFSWQKTIPEEELPKALEELKFLLAEWILGRKWAALQVITNSHSEIYLNGKLRGVGKANMPFLKPGDYTIKLKDRSVFGKEINVTLEAGEKKQLKTTLAEKEGILYVIESAPEGANLYNGNLYIGKTPYLLEKKDKDIVLKIRKDGYHDRSFLLTDKSRGVQKFRLSRFFEDHSRGLKRQRSRFFWSMGVMTSGFIAFFILKGNISNITERMELRQAEIEGLTGIKDYYDDFYLKLRSQHNRGIKAQNLLMSFNIVMLVNTFISFADYVQAASDSLQ